MASIKKPRVCFDCGSQNFVEDHAAGDLICRDCGVVNEAHLIDERSEWRTFSDKDKETADPNRVGGPENPLLGPSQMSTAIAGSKGTMAAASRLQKLHMRANGGGRKMQEARRCINHTCAELHLSTRISSHALELFDKPGRVYNFVPCLSRPSEDLHCPEVPRVLLQYQQLSAKAFKLKAMCGACIYFAAKVQKRQQTHKDVAAVMADVEFKDIGRCYQKLTAALKQEQTDKGEGTGTQFLLHGQLVQSKNTAVSDYVETYGGRLGFSWDATQAAKHMAVQASQEASAHKRDWEGRSPTTIAATIVYIVSMLSKDGQVPTFQDLWAHTEVTESTVKKTYAQMYKEVEALANLPVPKELQPAALLAK